MMSLAVIVAIVTAPTAVVVTVNEAVLDPGRTVTVPGTIAWALLLESDTGCPPAPAAEVSVTVPVDVPVPPVTEVGDSLRLESWIGGLESAELWFALEPWPRHVV